MPRPERVSSIQALAWLNAIVEDDSEDEIEDENVVFTRKKLEVLSEKEFYVSARR